MASQAPRAPLPGAVLFACNFNRVRSPMAEALLKRAVGDRVYVDSCGLKREPGEPGEGADPFVRSVMEEISVDLASHAPKTFDQLEDASFDLVISLTPEAQHRAVEMTRGRAAEIEYWPTFDPTLADGSREARMAAYREVRDHLAKRIAERFPR
ncbi:ArsC family transcriptional regulator [Phenylobacterium sp. Root77]|jgi:protein-tyrosine-phosphatase|uniref:arsenate-mycothiol transferase ArsC n=1 Tax=unclassified Phenylobacterium TaxID=2640670 RepID=UPI0006F4AE60|nr:MULTISPECIES: low molecular weight phosphatase family protein [unclassified Phenylobacterium]KQW66440.1 ArsC family transcriptional regulator [Phenylobacterium sp. Root1277]KQW88946.1 ArsC family transcriptional regulator [Phenylobacterium sp. Root1290]KRC42198.1 ArsC family transcriptional regulator [Phenylobacterium sp. Root77]